MRARDIIGRTVRSVHQERQFIREMTGEYEWSLKSVVFTDGTILVVHACEGDCDQYVTGSVINKPTRRRKP